MTGWSYVRGDYPAIVRGRAFAAFRGQGAEKHARALLAVMTEESSLEDLLDPVLAEGIGALSDFCLGRLDGDRLLAVLRGSAVITIEDDRWRRSTIDGSGSRTWREVAFDGVSRLAVGFEMHPVRTDLRAVHDDESAVRAGALAARELVFRSDDAPERLITITATDPAATAALPEDFAPDLFEPAPSAEAPLAQTPARRTGAPPERPRAAGPGAASAPPPAGREDADTDGYRFDDLFGETRIVGVEDAAVRETEDEEQPAEVSGLVCAAGHANPPTRDSCVMCGAALSDARPARVNRPPMGMLGLPDGRRIRIDAQMIIGRSPRAERSGGRQLPTLVKIDGAPTDVSRNHARLVVEGWNLVVEDLGSMNGTVVVSADGSIRRLRGGETSLITAGAVLDLGGLRITVEEAP